MIDVAAFTWQKRTNSISLFSVKDSFFFCEATFHLNLVHGSNLAGYLANDNVARSQKLHIYIFYKRIQLLPFQKTMNAPKSGYRVFSANSSVACTELAKKITE